MHRSQHHPVRDRLEPGVSKHGEKVFAVADVGACDLDVQGQFIGGISYDVGFVSEPPVVSPVFVALLRPSCIMVRGLQAPRVGGNVRAVNRDYAPQIWQMLTQLLDAISNEFSDQSDALAEFNNEPTVSSLAGDCHRSGFFVQPKTD